jgi:aminoglycoside 6'-N-acetyltransferase
VIAFRALRRQDLPLIRHWLGQPHVTRWWGPADGELAKIRAHLDTPDGVDCHLFSLDGRPAGFLQCYRPADWPDGPFGPQPVDARGRDLIIGEAALLGQGLGTRVVRQFLDGLFAAGVPRVLIDPDPANARAIRSYEKAGFRAFGRVEVHALGPALLMACDRPSPG